MIFLFNYCKMYHLYYSNKCQLNRTYNFQCSGNSNYFGPSAVLYSLRVYVFHIYIDFQILVLNLEAPVGRKRYLIILFFYSEIFGTMREKSENYRLAATDSCRFWWYLWKSGSYDRHQRFAVWYELRSNVWGLERTSKITL